MLPLASADLLGDPRRRVDLRDQDPSDCLSSLADVAFPGSHLLQQDLPDEVVAGRLKGSHESHVYVSAVSAVVCGDV